MTLSNRFSNCRTHWTGTCLALVLLVGLSATPATAAHGLKAKPLSLTNITVVGPAAQSISPWWIADENGYFKKQGLNISYLLTGGTVASWIAVLFAGSAQFLQGNASSEILAAQSGGPIRAIAMTSSPTGNELYLTSAAVAKFHVPTKSRSVKNVRDQLLALKGSHAKIAVSGTTSDGYNWLIGISRANGLTVGLNSPTSDINVDVVASSTLLASTVDSGQADGLAGTPQTALATPGVLGIPYFKLPPASSSVGQYACTTIDMIQHHADVVQAVVTALTSATEFIKKSPAKALKIEGPKFVNLGFTDPAQQSLIFYTGYENFAYLIYPQKAAYIAEVALVNGAQTPALTMPWSQFCVTRFALKALKQLGLKIPKPTTYVSG